MTEAHDTNWMAGFPPAPDKAVRFEDGSFYEWPQLRWSFSNIQQLVPTKSVWRGAEAAGELTLKSAGFESLMIETEAGESLSWQDALATTYTDGLAVMHKGVLVHESYFGACEPHRPHAIMSCAKSVAGMLAEMLIGEGVLDEAALIPQYLPELGGTAWADATLRQVMDMLIGMEFHEDYLDANSDVWRYLRSGGMVPMAGNTEGPQSLMDYLVGVRKEGEHGAAFAYREPNINVLTFVIQRVTGTDLSVLASARLWQHTGAEHDACYMLDPVGSCTTMSCTLRDFTRFGEFLRTDEAVRPVVERIVAGGDQDLFAKAGMDAMKGWSYKSQWWIRHMDRGTAMVARGAHGQLLYIDPSSELVITRFASPQLSPGYLMDHTVMPTFDAITAHVG